MQKFYFPFITRGGTQAIFSAENIPNNIPIILIHSSKDPQLSYGDSLAIYYALKKTGNQNFYLITINKKGHVLRLTEAKTEIAFINTIFKKHHLPYSEKALQDFARIDLSKFQPSLEEAKQHFDDLVTKETIHQSAVWWMLVLISTAAVWYFGYL